MTKLYGEEALAYAVQTGAQLYYQDPADQRDRPVSRTEAQNLLPIDPGGITCERWPRHGGGVDRRKVA